MLLFRTKITTAFLVLSIVGSHVNAADAGYVAQAKQKARNMRDWSAQVADKGREKANNAYALACEKTRVLIEKVKENKKFVAAAVAYLAYEAVGRYQGWNTPYRCLFELPGELATANNVTIPGLNGQLNTANANLNTANTVTIPGLNNTINGHLGTIANLNNVTIPNLNANIVNLQNTINNHLVTIANLNGHLNFANADLDTANNVTIPGLNARIVNLQDTVNNHLGTIANLTNVVIPDLNGQLEAARANLNADNRDLNDHIVNLQNTVNTHLATIANLNDVVIPNLNNQLRAARIDLNTANTVTIPGLNANIVNLQQELVREGQEASQTQNELLTELEQEVEAQGILQGRVNQLQTAQQQAQRELQRLAQENQDRIQIQEKNLREAYEQGRAQALFDVRHAAINNELAKFSQEVNSAVQDYQYQLDACRIISDLLQQERELVQCQASLGVAYPDSHDKVVDVQETFATLINATQQTINHVINQISDQAQWLANDTKEMNFVGTADNFDQELGITYSHIHNYFAQLNNACDQFNWIVAVSNTNQTIKFGLDRCANAGEQSERTVQSLGAMIVNSLEKIEQLLLQDGDNTIVNSYDDAFNLYAQSVVATSAYESYSNFCAMMPSSQELSDWAKQFEERIAFINNTVLTGNVHLKNGSLTSSISTLGNSAFYNSTIDMLNTNGLNTSVINNLDLSVFLANPIDSVAQYNLLATSLLSRSRLGTSSIFASTNENPVDDLDDLLKLATEKSEKEWEDELNAMGQSIIDFGNSSVLHSNNSFLNRSNLMSSSLNNSVNLGNSIKLAASVSSFIGNASSQSCPFVSFDKWASPIATLDASILNGRANGRYSRFVPYVPVNLQGSVMNSGHNNLITNKSVRRNNNSDNVSEEHIVSDSLIINHFFKPRASNNVNADKPNANYTKSALFAEFAEEESTTAAISTTSTHLNADSIIENNDYGDIDIFKAQTF